MKKIILFLLIICSFCTTNAQQFSGYKITSAKVTIKTGDDQKEYPTPVKAYIFPLTSLIATNDIALAQENYTNEMGPNSSTDLNLIRFSKKFVPWPTPKKGFTSGAGDWFLEDLNRQGLGLRLVILYGAGAFDAWKVNQVIIRLEIKKDDGTLHPTLNNKPIVFDIKTPRLGILTGTALVCETDYMLSPITHYLKNVLQ